MYIVVLNLHVAWLFNIETNLSSGSSMVRVSHRIGLDPKVAGSIPCLVLRNIFFGVCDKA